MFFICCRLVILLGFTEGGDDEFDFAGGEEMGLLRHAKFTELFTEAGHGVNPEVEVVEGTAGCAGFREIEHGEFGLAVGSDFESIFRIHNDADYGVNEG